MNNKDIINIINERIDYYNNKVKPDQSRFDRGCAMGAMVALNELKEIIESSENKQGEMTLEEAIEAIKKTYEVSKIK